MSSILISLGVSCSVFSQECMSLILMAEGAHVSRPPFVHLKEALPQ